MNEPDISPTFCLGHPWHFKHSWGSLPLRPFMDTTKDQSELQSEDHIQLQSSQAQTSEVQKSLW